MKIEKTFTYYRIFIGSHYFTLIRSHKRNIKRSRKYSCKIIEMASKLMTEDLQDMSDYLVKLLEYRRLEK